MSLAFNHYANEDNYEDSLLRVAVSPELYRQNPFRLLGVSIYSSDRDIKKQGELLEMMIKRGGGSATQSKGPLPLEVALDQHSVREALHRLMDTEKRFVDEFFWFWPESAEGAKTDTSLLALAGNDIKTASDIWSRQETQWGNDGIAIHNMAVLYHTLALDVELNQSSSNFNQNERDGHWEKAFYYWKLLLETEAFWGRINTRIRELNDPRLTVAFGRKLRIELPQTLLSINAKLASISAGRGHKEDAERHFRLMRLSGFDIADLEETGNEAVEPIRIQVEKLCAELLAQADADPDNANAITNRLTDEAKPLLETVNNILPEGNTTRDGMHDMVAITILECAINFGNKTDRWSEALLLLTSATTIATGELAQHRVNENILIFRCLEISAKLWKIQKSDKDDEKKAKSIKSQVIPPYKKILKEWKDGFDRKQLNLLGDDIALILNTLAVSINNNQKNRVLALEVIEPALDYCVDLTIRKDIEANKYIIYANHIEEEIRNRCLAITNDSQIPAVKIAIEANLKEADKKIPYGDVGRDNIAYVVLYAMVDFIEKDKYAHESYRAKKWAFVLEILTLSLPFAVSSEAYNKIVENIGIARDSVLALNPYYSPGVSSSSTSSSTSSYYTKTKPLSSSASTLFGSYDETYTSSPLTKGSTTSTIAGTQYYREKASGLATATFIVGILSIFLCGFLGIVSIIMGAAEMDNINKGIASAAGRERTKAGIILGIISICLSILLFIIRR